VNAWQEDLLQVAQGSACEQALFDRVCHAARNLGFEYCAYGLRIPKPFSNPQVQLLSNYPRRWRERYQEQGYLATDPSVQRCRQSIDPVVWDEALFANTPQLWAEAQSFGLRHGWAQSSLDALGVGGMLTLARSCETLTSAWLASEEMKMRWLVCVAHVSLSRLCKRRVLMNGRVELSAREVEVLQWTADGKTSGEIGDILALSENTVNFHIKNAVAKLRACNKTSAVVQAALLGLLSQ